MTPASRRARQSGARRGAKGAALGARLLTVLAIAAASLAGAAAAQAAPDPGRGDLRVVVFGDFNGPYGSVDYPNAVARVVTAIVEDWRPDLVLLPGDLVAGQARGLPDARFAEMWSAFDAAVAAPLRRAGVPYAASLGNHDASKLRGADGAFLFARERDAAAAYWRDPSHRAGLDVVDAAALPFAWSLRIGPLFVALIDASGPLLDADERAWLASTLDTPAARDADLRWVMGHLPLVGISEGRARDGEVLWRAEALGVLMRDAGVDTYISGHHAAFYAATWGELELLFAGGVGARSLVGSGLPPRSAVAVVDIDLESRRVRIRAYDPATLRPLPSEALPAAVEGFGGRLERSTRVAP